MKIGDKASEILGRDQDGSGLRLDDFKGQKLVLYFYPKGNTSGCTTEVCNLRDDYERFLAQGYAIVDVSMQDGRLHKKFIEKHQLLFPLIADTEKTLSNTFGVWGEKNMYGRKYVGTSRITFITDEEGKIERIIIPKEVKMKEHVQQIPDQHWISLWLHQDCKDLQHRRATFSITPIQGISSKRKYFLLLRTSLPLGPFNGPYLTWTGVPGFDLVCSSLRNLRITISGLHMIWNPNVYLVGTS